MFQQNTTKHTYRVFYSKHMGRLKIPQDLLVLWDNLHSELLPEWCHGKKINNFKRHVFFENNASTQPLKTKLTKRQSKFHLSSHIPFVLAFAYCMWNTTAEVRSQISHSHLPLLNMLKKKFLFHCYNMWRHDNWDVMAKDSGLQDFKHIQRGLHVDQQMKSHASVVLRTGVNFKICSLA